VIFADDAGHAHARRWTNRQSCRSAIRPETHVVLIVSEAMDDTGQHDSALREELREALTLCLDRDDLTPTTRQSMLLADPAAFGVEPFSCRRPALRPVSLLNDHGVRCVVGAPQRALWNGLWGSHDSRFACSGLASRELAASGEHERQALIVEPGDITGLSTALERLLEDGELRARLGKAARQRAQTLPTWEIQPNLFLRRCAHSTPNCRIAPRRSGVRSSHFLARPDKVDLQGVGVTRQDGTLHCQPDK
jgi:hypothetical protein